MYEYETFHETNEPNPWNWETRETPKLMKSQTQGIRKVLMKFLSLDETYYYETYENSWNHETSKL